MVTPGPQPPSQTITTCSLLSALERALVIARLENALVMMASGERAAVVPHALMIALDMAHARVSRSLLVTMCPTTFFRMLRRNMTLPGMQSTTMAASAMTGSVALTAVLLSAHQQPTRSAVMDPRRVVTAQVVELATTALDSASATQDTQVKSARLKLTVSKSNYWSSQQRDMRSTYTYIHIHN